MKLLVLFQIKYLTDHGDGKKQEVNDDVLERDHVASAASAASAESAATVPRKWRAPRL